VDRIISEIQTALFEGEAQIIKNKVEKALAMKFEPNIILQKALLPGMKIVGQRFRRNEIFIPDVLLSSRAMHAALYVLKPIITNNGLSIKGRIVIGTVAGDLHDIGKNMVSMVLEGTGYEVVDVGIDVPADDFIAAIKEYKPDVVGLTALLTTTMMELSNVMETIDKEGLREQVKIFVGGGPITVDFAASIEADAYVADAFTAVKVIKRLMKGEVGIYS
jgi:5-methyltetrahydrofolate--homocysteine methyltransferase